MLLAYGRVGRCSQVCHGVHRCRDCIVFGLQQLTGSCLLLTSLEGLVLTLAAKSMWDLGCMIHTSPPSLCTIMPNLATSFLKKARQFKLYLL